MPCLARILLAVFMLAPLSASAQLREFEITPVQNNRIPVFRDHPEMAAVIVNSSMTNLRFESNLEVVATLGDVSQGEYILIVRPVRQIVSVSAPGYQQGRITISPTEARQVLYFRVEPKPEVAVNVIPTVFQINPNDAIVSIDGIRVDASKPVLTEIGTHRLKIEKQGYRTIEKEVRISPEQNFIQETLSAIEPVPLTIRTQPAGSTILMDGVQAGVTDRSGALGMFRFPGSYELTVQLSGYVSDVRTITVTESGPNAFTSTLQRNAGTLQLRVMPADATVLLNREPHNGSAAAELAPGMYRIEVSKEGHEPFSETVEISRGQTLTRTIALVAHLGGLQITTAPLEATWSLTNAAGAVAASGTGLARKTGIPVGTYSLLVKASGHQDHSEAIRIERDRVIERNVLLREGPAACGSTITDIDGNTYKTVQIGTQCWMAENLKTGKYRDGSPIPNVTGASQWASLTTGAWATYDNNAANNATYGKLYNWYAVADGRNVCPVGWHVPSDSEWTILSTHLNTDPGHKMKSTSGWSNNGNGSNTSGFTGLPGGTRSLDGAFYFVGSYGYFWSSTQNLTDVAWLRVLSNGARVLGRLNNYKGYGFSVRCLRD